MKIKLSFCYCYSNMSLLNVYNKMSDRTWQERSLSDCKLYRCTYWVFKQLDIILVHYALLCLLLLSIMTTMLCCYCSEVKATFILKITKNLEILCTPVLISSQNHEMWRLTFHKYIDGFHCHATENQIENYSVDKVKKL